MVTIHEGSILDVKADALVNPANCFLQHNGGLAFAIASAARGPRDSNGVLDPVGVMWGREQVGLVATGDVKVTSPGRLADLGFKGIIHAVGPIWGGGKLYEAELLDAAYYRAFAEAAHQGWKSVVAPAISAGVFGVPIHIVAEAAYNACDVFRYGARYPNITFALTDPNHIKAFRRFF